MGYQKGNNNGGGFSTSNNGPPTSHQRVLDGKTISNNYGSTYEREPAVSASPAIEAASDEEEQNSLLDGSEPLPKWNNPSINVWRFLATNYSFIILGLNDASYGPLLPYLEKYYNVTYTVISLIFLSPLLGYIASACLSNAIHMRFGQRGVAILGPSAHLIAYIIISLHPPYPVLVVAFVIGGFGNGIADAAWNAWIGGMSNANELLGFLHGFYGVGGVLAPTVATSLITKANWEWYQFYYLVVGAAFFELVFMTTAFWDATGEEYRETHKVVTSDSDTDSDGLIPSGESSGFDKVLHAILGNGRTAEAAKNKVTWLCSLFLVIYAGAEVGLGGWIVTFMIRVRHASPFASGMASTGFWLGVTIGRFVLGFVTPRLFRSEKHAVSVYLVCCVTLQLLFWLIPNFYVSAIMVALLGFFLGPLFPAAIVTATKLLPKHIHVSAIGFAAALGASGATILPFAVGVVAESKGVGILQPFILAMLVVDLGVWLCFPSLSKKGR